MRRDVERARVCADEGMTISRARPTTLGARGYLEADGGDSSTVQDSSNHPEDTRARRAHPIRAFDPTEPARDSRDSRHSAPSSSISIDMAYAHHPNGPQHGPGVVMQTVSMNNELFGCFEDCADCAYGYFCFPCHLGSIAQRSGAGDCCLTCCVSSLLQPILPLALCYNAVQCPETSRKIAWGQRRKFRPVVLALLLLLTVPNVSREVNDRQAAAASMPHWIGDERNRRSCRAGAGVSSPPDRRRGRGRRAKTTSARGENAHASTEIVRLAAHRDVRETSTRRERCRSRSIHLTRRWVHSPGRFGPCRDARRRRADSAREPIAARAIPRRFGASPCVERSTTTAPRTRSSDTDRLDYFSSTRRRRPETRARRARRRRRRRRRR